MTGLSVAFLALVGAVAIGLVAMLGTVLSRRSAAIAAAGLAAWLTYVGALGAAGVVRDPALRPPGIAFVVGPAVLFVLVAVVRSRRGGELARALPLPLLIGFQSYRVGVELVLHALWRDGLVPRMLTWSGANVDLWIGLSAPAIAWAAQQGPGGRRLAGAWSVAGLLSLANVVTRSALTTPGPLRLLAAEVPNRATGTFPYTFIAGFLAPLAVALHVLALRALATSDGMGRPLAGEAA